MPDIQGILAIIGAIALFAGLFGGFKAKDLEVPALPKALRFSAFFIGVVFIGIAIWPFIRKEILTNSSSAITPTTINILPTNTPVLPASTPIPVNNCPFRELADEINVGQNTGACTTMPLTKFVEIINGTDVYVAIDKLDKAFEADIRTGYQYRELIPARIPPAPSRQRVMWGSLNWVDELASGQKEQTNSRIYRIRCNFTNPCIYVILDDGEFNVGYPGRGILLSEPLSDEILQRLSQ
jgi:hypothetical protein